MAQYKIIRMHRSGRSRVIERHLTLDEAKRHCSREDTHKKDKDGHVIWFDGYEQE